MATYYGALFDGDCGPNDPPSQEFRHERFPQVKHDLQEMIGDDILRMALEMDDFVEYDVVDHESGEKIGRAFIERQRES
jgi:hypothetical protein